MAKTPDERPALADPTQPTAPAEDAPAKKKWHPGYDPSPGYRLFVCRATDDGIDLPSPRYWTQPVELAPGTYDQAEYLLRAQKPARTKTPDWWHEASPEEMAAYQAESGAYGSSELGLKHRKDWLEHHPEVRVGPPPREDVAAEERRMRSFAKAVIGEVAEHLGPALAKRAAKGDQP